jgi:CRISPR/Cas system-associated protein Cas10 (large subunit of type III CRISPR-Cas system)
MATSSFTTVFKMPKKALREIAKNIDKPVVRFKLSEKDKGKSRHQWREIPEMVGQQQELSLEQLGSWLGYADSRYQVELSHFPHPKNFSFFFGPC